MNYETGENHKSCSVTFEKERKTFKSIAKFTVHDWALYGLSWFFSPVPTRYSYAGSIQQIGHWCMLYDYFCVATGQTHLLPTTVSCNCNFIFRTWHFETCFFACEAIFQSGSRSCVYIIFPEIKSVKNVHCDNNALFLVPRHGSSSSALWTSPHERAHQ